MNELLNGMTCSASECLCWILVLMNIFAIFYLVFCSFCKVNKVVKIIGWVWLAEMLTATISVLIIHTCLYTLLATVFTTMIMMAMLFVVLPDNKKSSEEIKEQKGGKLGSYVISKTDDERYVFALYDDSRKLIARSNYSYSSVEEVKQEIVNCRDNGMMAAVRTSIGAWIKESNFPNFEVYVKNGSYYFRLNINDEYAILNSTVFSDVKKCISNLQKAKDLIASTNIYFNTDREVGANYNHFGKKEVIKEIQPVVESPEEVKQEIVKLEPVVEEQVKEEIVQDPVEKKEDAVKEEIKVEEVEIKEQQEQPSEESKLGFDFNTISFEEKLELTSAENKERYQELKDVLIQYGAKSRISYSADTLKIGKDVVAKFGIKRTSLSLYLALDPKDYVETKYSFTDVSDVKKYSLVPMKVKIKSNRAVKWAKELIEDMIAKLGLNKEEN